MLSVIYVSVADPLIDEQGVAELLEQARRNNERNALTGALVYNGYNFLQLLEGPAGEVEACLAAIRRDTRHSGVTEIRRRAIEERDFAGWSMLYDRDIDGDRDDLSRLAAKGRIDPEDERIIANFTALGRRRAPHSQSAP